MPSTILIVEDDKILLDFLKRVLGEKGYVTLTTSHAAIVEEMISKHTPDLILLDLGLPDIRGESILISIKKRYPEIPVIVITAKNTTRDKVHTLEAGASDYVTKPFIIEELLARIYTHLKKQEQKVLSFHDLTINTATLEVQRSNMAILLTPTEFKLLTYFMQHQGTVLTRENILNHVWKYETDVNTRVVDVYIGLLRKKVCAGFPKKLIKTVPGFGYTLHVH